MYWADNLLLCSLQTTQIIMVSRKSSESEEITNCMSVSYELELGEEFDGILACMLVDVPVVLILEILKLVSECLAGIGIGVFGGEISIVVTKVTSRIANSSIDSGTKWRRKLGLQSVRS